ncbi:unnamed protein product [Kuraishia capsulata CBS 1993]|uniref:Zinc finger CHCC-type domain-containing protein n=1 Tax=Kuraishia capsulata CBS 1993 TaxID=1382522 RepID=W6MI71_9ASCO|nr:uncharacterized protein KUCA_T00001796001 [Kuraishia capsulata CBS 1993]CDK25826.1 unnamed protein product [Kuraishia capsulata CBS 1993]
MLRRGVYSVRQIRHQSSKVTATLKDVGVADPQDLTQQAPNRIAPWSKSQRPRSEAMTGPRFEGKDLEKQPRPYAAIDLIAKQPIRYIEHGNVAVCDGNTGIQGHPKVFINLDQKRANSCGYCGLRFAQAKFKADLEAQ